jgi:hypothetical protein
MMSGKNGIRQIIKALVTIRTFIALTGGFGVVKATLDDLSGLTRGALDAVWPPQLTYGLITLHIIDQILDIDLQGRTPVMGGEMGCDEFTPSSHPRPWNPT